VGYEPLGRDVLPAVVAAGQEAAAYEELSRRAQEDRLQRLIQEVELGVGNGEAPRGGAAGCGGRGSLLVLISTLINEEEGMLAIGRPLVSFSKASHE